MPTNATLVIAAGAALAVLTFIVGLVMLGTRVREMKAKRIPPAAVATSSAASAKYEDIRAADNFRNLFETPVLFYSLVAASAGSGHVPTWLVGGAWAFVLLRVAHSVIHCTYNNVMHRLTAFMSAFALVVSMWVLFAISLASKSAA